MSRIVAILFTAILFAAATGGMGFWLGTHPGVIAPYVDRGKAAFRAQAPMTTLKPSGLPPSGLVAYYRDPDGNPVYAAAPRKTGDGRDFIAIDAVDDVRFDGTGTMKAARPIPMATTVAPQKIKFYRNPMGLPDTSPMPKKDSMGMDYIPVMEGETDDGTVITVSPGKLQRTGVRSEPVEMRRIARTVRVPGTVQIDERLVSVVSTRSDAFVEKVENVTTGDTVTRGQPLVSVYSPEINAAAAQYLSNPTFEGARRRLKNLDVSDDAIAEMERSRKVPTAVLWTAPRGGVILERVAIDGMKAAAGATLFRIGDLSTVWVLADVPERAIGGVRVGQTATVRIRALPNRTFTGRIALLYPQVNKETRSTRVRIELANADGALLPDMYADVAIATGTPEPVVAVPDDAVIDTGTKQTVILDRGAGKLEPRVVTLGVHGDGSVEITVGVAVGDRVVTSANFLIDAESNLKAALEGLAAANTETKP